MYNYPLIMEMPKNTNQTLFGTLVKSSKMIYFKKEEFKPELAPKRATIENLTIEGTEYVKMIY